MECLQCKYCQKHRECNEDGTTKDCIGVECGTCHREYENRCRGFMPVWEEGGAMKRGADD